jgi:hypothetical protein
MILLDDVVQVLARAHFDVAPTRMFTPQQPQNARRLGAWPSSVRPGPRAVERRCPFFSSPCRTGIACRGSVDSRVGRVLRLSITRRADRPRRDAKGVGESARQRVPGPSFVGLIGTMARQ